MSSRSGLFAVTLLLASSFTGLLRANDIQLGSTFVCNGERIYVENCNIRDLSDNASCLVAHPDRPQKNGLMAYTNETRGSLKKLLPTCKQPSAAEVQKANDFQRIQSQKLAANTKKANDELDASEAKVNSAITGKPASSSSEREMTRCIASGRNPTLCTGKQLDNFFGSAVAMVLPGANTPAEPGLSLSGSYQGRGQWRIDFDDRYAHTQCATLDSQPRDYSIGVRNNLAVVTINSAPKNIVLTLKPDGTLVGSGPITVNGYIIEGGGGGTYSAGQGHWDSHTTTTTHEYTPLEASSSGVAQDPTLSRNGQTYTTTSTSTTNTYTPGTPTYSGPGVSYIPKTASCTQAVLVSKGAVVDPGQNAANKLLFGGPSVPNAPVGLRMRGNYVGADGFSVEFYPDSAIVGCGQAARAYPYVVRANGSQAAIKIEDPEHPLLLAIKADGELDPSQGRYEVHGRNITGRNSNGDYTFTPLNATCNLVTLAAADAPAPSAGPKPVASGWNPSVLAGALAAPSATGAAAPEAPATATRSAPSTTASVATANPTRSAPSTTASVATANPTRSAPATTASATGSAVLSISSGLSGMPNPLASHPYLLLRESFASILAKAGVQVPAGTSPYKVLGYACGNHLPDCQKIMSAVNANAASAVRADATGKATFPSVTEGTYYLMISARYNNQALVWDMPVHLKAGSNSLTLEQANASTVQ